MARIAVDPWAGSAARVVRREERAVMGGEMNRGEMMRPKGVISIPRTG
jgi:hypothetical protein